MRKASSTFFDPVSLDAERSEYTTWWPELRRVIRPGGLLVADNAISHAAEMAPLIALLKDDPAVTMCVVPVGKGELVAVLATA